jgi:hypothetical protein
MSDLIKIAGKVSAEGASELYERLEADEDVGEVAILVLATMTSGSKVKTAHRGTDRVVGLTMSTAILATGKEHKELLKRLGDQRAKQIEEKTGQTSLLSGDAGMQRREELEAFSRDELKVKCKELGLSQSGAKSDLVQRLLDNGG